MKSVSINWRKGIRGCTLLFFSLYLLKLSSSNEIHLLVSDTIAKIVAFTIYPLILVSIVVLFCSISIHTVPVPTQQHKSRLNLWGTCTICLCILALTVGLSWQPKALGSEMIAQSKSLSPGNVSTDASQYATSNDSSMLDPSAVGNQPLSQIQNQDQYVVKQKSAEESEASFAIAYQANPQSFNGKSITLDGFVYHNPALPSNYFILTRYFVFCCIADAYPIGVTVRDVDGSSFQNDTWVHVTGQIETRPLPVLDQLQPTDWFPSTPNKPVLHAISIQKIPTPAQPYMMPR